MPVLSHRLAFGSGRVVQLLRVETVIAWFAITGASVFCTSGSTQQLSASDKSGKDQSHCGFPRRPNNMVRCKTSRAARTREVYNGEPSLIELHWSATSNTEEVLDAVHHVGRSVQSAFWYTIAASACQPRSERPSHKMALDQFSSVLIKRKLLRLQ